MSDIIERIRSAKAIKLECPRTVTAICWRPAEPVILGRVDALERQAPGSHPLVKLPATVSVPSTADETITLRCRIGQGHLWWDIYEASVGDAPGVIAKILDLTCMDGYGRSETLAEYTQEFHIFSHLCESLQGSALPRLGGMFGDATGNLWCTLYENAGRALKYEEKFDVEIGRQVMAAVKATHALGVMTGPSHYGWLRISDDGSIKLTEFESARSADTITSDTLETLERLAKRKLDVGELLEGWRGRGVERVTDLYIALRPDMEKYLAAP